MWCASREIWLFGDSRDSRDNRDNREIYYHSDDTLFRCGLFRLCGLCGLKKTFPSTTTPISCQKGAHNRYYLHDRISCQKGSDVVSIKKFGWMGHTKRISHSAEWLRGRRWPLITRNYFLSEGRRVLHSAKKATMGSTWTHVPLSPFLLGAAIDPLSQEILN